MNNFKNWPPKHQAILLTAVIAFTAGLLVPEPTPAEPTPAEVTEPVYLDTKRVTIQYDYSRLTQATCRTDEECDIAEAVAYYNDFKADTPRYQTWRDYEYWTNLQSIPIIEPVDCEAGDKECEQSNKDNAGKTAHYPAIYEPYIFKE